MVPKISDDGSIDGSLIILNKSQTNKGLFKITDDVEHLKKYSNH